MVRQQLGFDADQLGGIFAVAAHDGVGQRFGDGDLQPEPEPGVGSNAGEAVPGHEAHRVLDAVHVARHREVHPGAGGSEPGNGSAADDQLQRGCGHRRPLEVGERLLGGIRDREQGIELGELEERPQIFVEAGEAELTSGVANPPGQRHQRAEPGRIDVPGGGEIDQELALAGVQRACRPSP